jgi:hypothetical protein
MSETTRVWFCATPKGNKGPFDEAKMLELLKSGVIGGNTYIWREGMDNWVLLRQSGDFSPISQVSAPPTREEAPAAAAPTALVPQGQGEDELMDAVFIEQVRKSWERYAQHRRASEVDEVLVGGVITACLDNGYALIDLSSDGTHHHLRFERLEDGSRAIFRLTHLGGSLLNAKVLGHQAQVVLGYGERVKDFQKVWQAIKQEIKGGYISQAEPGILTVDGDISSQYVYVEVGLLWDLQDYMAGDDLYRVNYPKLTQHVGAGLHALKKYLRGRFAA